MLFLKCKFVEEKTGILINIDVHEKINIHNNYYMLRIIIRVY